MQIKPAIYLLTDKCNGKIYTGITNNLPLRIRQHRSHAVAGFTKQFDSSLLVYYALYQSMSDAHRRKAELRELSRVKKTNLIEAINPKWRDLYSLLLI